MSTAPDNSLVDDERRHQLEWLTGLIRHGRDPLSTTHKTILGLVRELVDAGDPEGHAERLLDILCWLYRYPEPVSA